MKLFLIRHGETDWNIEGKIQGRSNIELNENGIIQAKELGDKILEDRYKFSKLYSSPQKRAVKTTEIVSNIINVNYEIIDDLCEVNFGEWEGLTWKEARENYKEEYDIWYKSRRYTKPPKGESYQEMIDRVLVVIRELIKENKNNEDIAIVTHSAVIMSLQCHLTNTPFEKMINFKCDNTSIVEIDSNLLVEI